MRSFIAVVCLSIAMCNATLRAEETPPTVAGNWLGTMNFFVDQLRIGVQVTEKNGKLSASVDSYDQASLEIPVTSIKVHDDTLELELNGLGASYTGKLNADRTECEGFWTQGIPWALTLKKVVQLPELDRPQKPQPPFPYTETEVVVPCADNVKLAGTLTLPPGEGPFPVVITITGSGPQDRDEMISGHQPFLLWADTLARRGIAVLRCDDRGVGKSTGSFSTATIQNCAKDVRAQMDFLARQPKIDSQRIGLLGHSEGGCVAPLAASEYPDVAFIVILAGPGISGDEVIYLQGERIARQLGADDVAIARQKKIQTVMLQAVKEGLSEKEILAKLETSWQEMEKGMGLLEKGIAALQWPMVQEQVKTFSEPTLRALVEYDPVPVLEKVRCPVLAVNGGNDLQVPPRENLTPIAMALAKGGNQDFTIRELPGLNHLLQTSATGSIFEYGKITETISPRVLTVVADWIEAHCRK
jgi:pimeloyl-ACP methyl ester carboxylesterase